ncbi:hypothetical protein JCM8097_009585 [Rhodosporidiobolus ruineniae]
MLRLSLAVALLGAAGVLAQTGSDIYTEQQTVATVIPGTCSTTCNPWLTTVSSCGAGTDTGFQACVCDATYQANLAACSDCFTTEADSNAATVDTAVTDLTNYCNGVTVSSSTTDTSSSSTTDTSSSTTTTPVVAVATSASSASSASASVTSSSSTKTSAAVQTGWPSQTKSANVFAGAAAPGVTVDRWATGAAIALGAVASGMMLV